MRPEQAVLAAAAVIALIAAIFDWRSRRIPNWLSVSGLATGLLFRGLFEGTAGLADAAAGLAIAALPLLLLWLIGGGGGGDVKLMAALSVWLGHDRSTLLLIGSAAAVLALHIAVIIYRGLTLRRKDDGQARLRVAFAIPVCLAAWVLVAADVLHAVHP